LLKQLGVRLAHPNNILPDTLKTLTDLPGVGPYAAAAFLSFHTNKRGVLIDANVVRWLCRMIDKPMDGETRREKWLLELADSLTPYRNSRAYNYAVLDFSMLICSVRPKCNLCPLGPKYCIFRRNHPI
jgi:A/G-specific adenine glycosylase